MSDATNHEILDVDVVEDEPLEGVSPALIRSGLESEDPIVRAHAARVAESMASGDPDAILEVIPAVIDGLDDDRRVVVTKCTITLSTLSGDHPEALEPAVPRLVELVGNDLSLVRVLASQSLGQIALENPETLLGHEDLLVDALFLEHEDAIDRETLAEETDSSTTFEVVNRMNLDEDARHMVSKSVAANLLVEVGERDPERLVADADRIVAALEAAPSATVPCLQVLGQIAREDRSAVAGATDAVVDFLDSPDEEEVASAISALGYVRDPDAIEPLRDLSADENRDENLRALAEETAGFIEDASR